MARNYSVCPQIGCQQQILGDLEEHLRVSCIKNVKCCETSYVNNGLVVNYYIPSKLRLEGVEMEPVLGNFSNKMK